MWLTIVLHSWSYVCPARTLSLGRSVAHNGYPSNESARRCVAFAAICSPVRYVERIRDVSTDKCLVSLFSQMSLVRKYTRPFCFGMPVHALTAAMKCDMNVVAMDMIHTRTTYGLMMKFFLKLWRWLLRHEYLQSAFSTFILKKTNLKAYVYHWILGKGKGKVHPCTDTEALYRPYDP
jgi:hypothetical protein